MKSMSVDRETGRPENVLMEHRVSFSNSLHYMWKADRVCIQTKIVSVKDIVFRRWIATSKMVLEHVPS